MSEFATAAWKCFSGKFIVKIDFPIRHFMLALQTLTLIRTKYAFFLKIFGKNG